MLGIYIAFEGLRAFVRWLVLPQHEREYRKAVRHAKSKMQADEARYEWLKRMTH